jgi:hypothetical protein
MLFHAVKRCLDWNKCCTRTVVIVFWVSYNVAESYQKLKFTSIQCFQTICQYFGSAVDGLLGSGSRSVKLSKIEREKTKPNDRKFIIRS